MHPAFRHIFAVFLAVVVGASSLALGQAGPPPDREKRAPSEGVPTMPGAAGPSETLTAKERLGGKWMDEQRVDDCKVPVDKRGARLRPDTCRDSPAR